jgi:hypothetical protein
VATRALLRQVSAIAPGLGIVVGGGSHAKRAEAYGQRKRSKAVAHLHLLAGLDSKFTGLNRQREPFRATAKPAILKNSDHPSIKEPAGRGGIRTLGAALS